MDRASTLLLVLGLSLAGAAIYLAPVDAPPELASCTLNTDCPANSRCAVLRGRRVCIPGLPPPPKANLVKALSLGRHAAAADIIWLRVIQFVGSDTFQAANYKGLAEWILLTVELNADFDMAYWYAGSLLPTSRKSAEEADAILRRGEKIRGDDWQIAMWRGFVAYYGKQDFEAAATHFERSVKLGGPDYLQKRAQTLRTESQNCRSLEKNLVQMRDGAKGSGGSLLTSEQMQKILVGCIEAKLEAAIATYRIDHGKGAESMQELLDAGLLDAKPPAPSGQCWFLAKRTGYLAPCVDGRRSDLPPGGQP